jgi:hypothetical protein
LARFINWLGVVAGVVVLLAVAVSVYVPWWQLVIGENLFTINASPLYTDFGLLGADFTIPLLWALNITCILFFLVSGIIMLVYSFIPTKPYAKDLIGFSYRKPFWFVVSFIISLVVLVLVGGFMGVAVPLMGTAEVSMPQFLAENLGADLSVNVAATFLASFWIALAGAVLCVAARVYHRSLTKKWEKLQQQPPAVPAEPTPTPVSSAPV